jgi:hypothetical protein
MVQPPTAVTVTAPLWLWGGEGGSWHFITVPEDQAGAFRAESLARRGGFGSVKVEATIGDVSWRTSVFPQKSGGYILPVKKEVRSRAGIAAGDDVTVILELIVD